MALKYNLISFPVTATILTRIQEWSKGRIRQSSFNALREGDYLGVWTALQPTGAERWGSTKYSYVGISPWGKDWSFTVVDPEYRGQGIATELIRRKPVTHTLVAKDNPTSLFACLRAGFIIWENTSSHSILRRQV